MAKKIGELIALWRYKVIAPLLFLVGTQRGALKEALEKLAQLTHQHPTRGEVQLHPRTMERWLYTYRKEGLEGLQPVPRGDHGKSRVIDDALAEEIESLVQARPRLDGPGILAELHAAAPTRHLPSLSTLYRFLRARGLDQRRAPQRRDHRAFAFDLAGDLWQGDVMYGPSLPTASGERRRTYLIAILDDATRLICHAQFYLEQHLRSVKDCLKQALLKRGVPRRLYFDNGKVFRSRLLLAVAARLGAVLIHTRPYRPQGRAKLERWFGTVRRGFLTRVDVDQLDGIDQLNRLLFAWLEGVYHVRPHRALDGETPLDRWMRLSEGIRPLPRDVDLDQLFLEEATRRVAKDGTIRIKGKVFEAGPRVIGHKVLVRFDPFDLRRVAVSCSANGTTPYDAFPVDLRANRHVSRCTPAPPAAPTQPPPPLRSLDKLYDELCDDPPKLADEPNDTDKSQEDRDDD